MRLRMCPVRGVRIQFRGDAGKLQIDAEAAIGKDRLVRRPMLMDRLTWKDGWPHVEGGTPSAGPVAAPSVLRK